MIHVQCSRCRTRFTTADTSAGRTGRCPKCGNPIPVPAEPRPAPAPVPSAGAASDAEADAPSAPQGRASPPSAASPGGEPSPVPQAPLPTESPEGRPPSEGAAAPSPAGVEPAAAEPAAAPCPGKSKTVALVLCALLGPLGTHRFYLGSWGWGLVILGLNLTCLGGLVFTVVDVVHLARLDPEEFRRRYADGVVQPFTF